MKTSPRERDAAYIRSAERFVQRTDAGQLRPSLANADTMLRHLSRMLRLAKWYRDSYVSLLGEPPAFLHTTDPLCATCGASFRENGDQCASCAYSPCDSDS